MRLYKQFNGASGRVQPKEMWGSVLANWISNLLGDIYHHQDTLLACYCSVREHSYDEAEYPAILEEYCKKFRNNDGYRDPFIIYGPPGIGKSTYIAHKLELARDSDFQVAYFMFDLRGVADFNFVHKSFLNELNEFLKNILDKKIEREHGKQYRLRYHVELFKDRLQDQIIAFDSENIDAAFDDEDVSKKLTHVLEERYLPDQKLVCIEKIKFLLERYNTQLVFVLDNFDHFEEYRSTHQYVFALAKEIVFDFKSPTFLPMRNYTLLDSYDVYGYREADKVRTKSLSCPDAECVLEKRVNYILENLESRVKKGNIEVGRNIIEQQLGNVLNGLIRNEYIVAFMKGIAGYNNRTLLWLLELALQSGHIDTGAKQPGDEYYRYHAFIKACAFCNNVIYTPAEERTPIINIFDNNENMSWQNTFVRIRVLQFCSYSTGPVNVQEIVKELGYIGYTESSVKSCLKVYLKSGIIEEVPYLRSSKKILDDSSYQLTDSGRYYLDHLSFDPIYIELMIPSINLPESFEVRMKAVLNTAKTKKELLEKYNAMLDIIEHIRSQENQEQEYIGSDARIMDGKYRKISQQVRSCIKKHWDKYFQKYQYS